MSTCDLSTFSEERRKQGLLQWLDSLQTESTSSPDLQLTMGAVIVEEMRAAIERQTSFQCSAGISHNKVKANSRFQRETYISIVKHRDRNKHKLKKTTTIKHSRDRQEWGIFLRFFFFNGGLFNSLY